MIKISFHITLAALLLLMVPATEADSPDEPYRFFREFVGLKEEQIAAIHSGKAVARVTYA